MHTRIPRQFVILIFAALPLLSACAAVPGADCSNEQAAAHLAIEQLGRDRVLLRATHETPPHEELEAIELLRDRGEAGCKYEQIDFYGYNGGPPKLEATFIHTVQGEPNLFVIVSWEQWHRAIGLKGTLYDVYAYRRVGDTLVLNDAVTKNNGVNTGFVGMLDFEESTFDGTTQAGVVRLLRQLGLE